MIPFLTSSELRFLQADRLFDVSNITLGWVTAKGGGISSALGRLLCDDALSTEGACTRTALSK